MGRILSDDDDDSQCIQSNLNKAKFRWRSLSRVLKREGADARTMAKFYLTIVQAVLLYGSESWCISQKDMNSLERFHKRSVRYITGKHIQKLGDGSWIYPNHDELFEKCNLKPINEYIKRRRETLKFIWKPIRKIFWILF